jgi:hypothetical protein
VTPRVCAEGLRGYFLPSRFYSREYPFTRVKSGMARGPPPRALWSARTAGPPCVRVSRRVRVAGTCPRSARPPAHVQPGFAWPRSSGRPRGALTLAAAHAQMQVAQHRAKQMRRLTAAFRRLARATEVPRPRPPPPRRLGLCTGAHVCKAARVVLLAPALSCWRRTCEEHRLLGACV